MATPATSTTTIATQPINSIISLVMDEVRQSLEPKISHVLADYQMYKETHDALLQIPFVKRLLENQCKCNSATKEPQSTPHDPIQLEIIDAAVDGLSNLDSITEYVNATVVSEAASEAEVSEEEAEVSEAEQEEEAEEEVSEAEEELELFEVEIKGKTYVTNDEMEGDIYEYVNDEVGEIVGAFRKGVAKFTKKPKSAQKK